MDGKVYLDTQGCQGQASEANQRRAGYLRDGTGFDVGRIENVSFAVDPFMPPRTRPSAPMMTRI
jgi:hypothetical protein